MHTAGTLLLVLFAMAAKDVASNTSIYLVSKGHGLWAGLADGMSDVATVLSIGVTAVLTTQHGFSLVTTLAFMALITGSVVGGVLGTRLGRAASDRLEQEVGNGSAGYEAVAAAPARPE